MNCIYRKNIKTVIHTAYPTHAQNHYIIQTHCLVHASSKQTNFNLNFLLYYASARGCYWRPRKSDASSKQSYSSKSAAMLKPNAEYNRRAVIIEGLRAGRSAMEIIRFFGYSRQPFIML